MCRCGILSGDLTAVFRKERRDDYPRNRPRLRHRRLRRRARGERPFPDAGARRYRHAGRPRFQPQARKNLRHAHDRYGKMEAGGRVD